MKAKTAGTIALAVVTPMLWWGTYRAFKPFQVSDLSGYDWSLVRFTVTPQNPAFVESDGAKTMSVTLFYPTDDLPTLQSKARAVCLRCAAEMRRQLPNDHRAVKLAVYKASEAQVAARPPKDPIEPLGDLTIDDPPRETAIPAAKENWPSQGGDILLGDILEVECRYLDGGLDDESWLLTVYGDGRGLLQVDLPRERSVSFSMPGKIGDLLAALVQCDVRNLPSHLGPPYVDEAVRRIKIRTSTFEKTIEIHGALDESRPNARVLEAWKHAMRIAEEAQQIPQHQEPGRRP